MRGSKVGTISETLESFNESLKRPFGRKIATNIIRDQMNGLIARTHGILFTIVTYEE